MRRGKTMGGGLGDGVELNEAGQAILALESGRCLGAAGTLGKL